MKTIKRWIGNIVHPNRCWSRSPKGWRCERSRKPGHRRHRYANVVKHLPLFEGWPTQTVWMHVWSDPGVYTWFDDDPADPGEIAADDVTFSKNGVTMTNTHEH